MTPNDTISKGVLLFIPSIGSQRNEAKRVRSFEVLQKIFYNTPHLYKGFQSAVERPKMKRFANRLQLVSLLYLPIDNGIYAHKIADTPYLF